MMPQKAAELTHQLSFDADKDNGGTVKAALAEAQAAHANEAH